MSETKCSAATPLQPRRRAILIGASSGIGAALARRLAREGYQVALLARREEQLKSLCEQINRESGEPRAFYYVHDVTAYDQVPGLLQHILEDLGGLDLFIYNTGINIPVKRTEFSFETDRQMLETNLLGALAWLNPVAAMFQSLKAGQIVGIGSVAGIVTSSAPWPITPSKPDSTLIWKALRNRLHPQRRRRFDGETWLCAYRHAQKCQHQPPVFGQHDRAGRRRHLESH